MGGWLSRFNWIDILVLFLLIRIVYISSYIGVGKQVLPLILLALILLFSMQNYNKLAEIIIQRYALAVSVARFLSFVFIILGASAVYRIISRILNLKPDTGQFPLLERIGGTVMGMVRAYLIVGLMLVGFTLTPSSFVERGIKTSYFAKFFIRTNIGLYDTLSRLLTRERVDVEVYYERLFAEKDFIIKRPFMAKEE